jgi:hypothetical protein
MKTKNAPDLKPKSILIASPQAYGIALVLFGQPLAWMARFLTGAANDLFYSVAVIGLGLLLSVDLRGLTPPRLHGKGWPLALTGFTLLIIIIMFFYSPYGAERDPLYFAAEALFFLTVITCRPQQFQSLPTAINQVSTLSIVLFLYQWFQQGGMFESTRAYIGDSGSPNQLANVAIASVLTGAQMLFTRRTGIYQFIAGALSLGTGVFAIVVAQTRSVFFGVVLWMIVVLLTVARRRSTRAQLHYIFWVSIRIGVLGFVFGAIMLSLQWDKIQARAELFEEYFVKGYQSFVLGEDNIEESAETRRNLRQKTLDEFDPLGHGYKYIYIDFPLLQAFSDGGVAFGLLFMITALVVPNWIAIKMLLSPHLTQVYGLVALITIQEVPNLFLHGQPYDYSHWFLLVVEIAVVSQFLEQSGKSVSMPRKNRLCSVPAKLKFASGINQ